MFYSVPSGEGFYFYYYVPGSDEYRPPALPIGKGRPPRPLAAFEIAPDLPNGAKPVGTGIVCKGIRCKGKGLEPVSSSGITGDTIFDSVASFFAGLVISRLIE